MSDPAAPPSRPMRYPYTLTAKIAQFPLKYHLNVNWYYRYFLYGAIPTFLIFCKINSLVNSEANKMRVKLEKEKEQHHLKEHLENLL